jgi:hypothetical protein
MTPSGCVWVVFYTKYTTPSSALDRNSQRTQSIVNCSFDLPAYFAENAFSANHNNGDCGLPIGIGHVQLISTRVDPM